jgi:hypothetical protein
VNHIFYFAIETRLSSAAAFGQLCSPTFSIVISNQVVDTCFEVVVSRYT